MPSTEPGSGRRRRGQSGQSMVEALVASMIVAIGIVAGLGTLDEAVIGARQVAHQAWARCMQREALEAVTAAPYSESGGYPAPAHVGLRVTALSSGVQALQRIEVSVTDPDSGGPVARVPPVSVYKAAVLAPVPAAGTYDPQAITAACRALQGTGP